MAKHKRNFDVPSLVLNESTAMDFIFHILIYGSIDFMMSSCLVSMPKRSSTQTAGMQRQKSMSKFDIGLVRGHLSIRSIATQAEMWSERMINGSRVCVMRLQKKSTTIEISEERFIFLQSD